MREDPFGEEMIVGYLLGDLPEERQAEIEDRAFQDREYLHRILAAESDLIDEYVRGGLSGSARRQFEGRFLASAERRRKVEFARALSSVLTETTVEGATGRPAVARPPLSFWDSLTAFVRGISPGARISIAAAALLIVAGGVWLVAETVRLRSQVGQLQAGQRDRQSLQDRLAEERTRNEELASRLQSEQQQGERRDELIRELERAREESAVKPAQPAVVSLALPAGIPRSGGARPRLVLPQSARLARLQIGIDPADDYESFRVELHAQGGRRVWAQDNLSARTTRTGRAITLNLPARILEAGPYELTLKGVTAGVTTEDIGYYYFEVLRK